MKLKVFLILALVVVGAGAVFVSLGGLRANAATGTTYLTAQAAIGDVSDDVAATGTVAPTATYGIAFGSPAHVVSSTTTAATGGGSGAAYPVKTVKVVVGDRVTTGQVLATASGADLQAAADSAANAYRVAKLQLDAARDELTAADDAADSTRIRQAKIGLYSAKNQEAQAHTAYSDARARLKDTTLKAPIDGVVTAVAIQAGFDAPSGDAVTIAASTYEVTADAVESDISSIGIGQAARVTVSAVGADLTGKVASISPVAGSGTNGVVSYAVTITLDSTPAELRDGMTADVTITTASATNVLTIPSAALRGTAGSYRVSTLDPATGAPAQRDVSVGLVTNTLAEITGGLTAGEAVITGTAAELSATTTSQGGVGAFPGGGFGGGQFRPGGNGGQGGTNRGGG